MGQGLYILRRRLKAFVGALTYILCRIFPIKNRKVVFSAFEGMGYCCNPKYIAEELIYRQHESGEKYELIWLVNDLSKKFPGEIKPVKNTLWHRAYHLSTAKIWVDNARKNYGTLKRKGQFYILTWHGMIGFKPVGRLRGQAFPKIAEIVSKYDANLVDLLLSDSEWCTNIWENAFWNEPIGKLGSPRCDILLNRREEQYKEIRNKFQISKNAKIVIYAPTFRGGSQEQKREVHTESFSMNFENVLNVLQQKFGGEWYMFIRLHPQLALKMKDAKRYESKHIIDISKEDDLYEILAAADAFISDYSSAAFDASFMKIPVFLYADDIDEYVNDRGALVWNIEDIPFPISKSNEDFIDQILSFDNDNYIKRLEVFFKEIGVLEDGKASKRVVDLIETKL